jgi:hypothetical protein
MGSRSTQRTEIPAYIEEAGKLALERAKQIQAMGYVPYMGSEVAAINPYEQAVAQNVGSMASAFGLSAPAAMSMGGMPTVTQGGITGYTSYPGYMSSLERLREVRPEMYNYFSNLTRFDPITGALNPEYDAMIQSLTAPQVAASSGAGGGGDDGPVFADEAHAANTAFAGGNQGFVNNDGFIDAPAPSSGPSLGNVFSGIRGAVNDFRDARNAAIDSLPGGN